MSTTINEMLSKVAKLMNDDYESFVKALIKYELELRYTDEVDDNRLDAIYQKYLKSDEPLLNEMILYGIPELDF
ncbi:hypothetical protein [uncultured Abiotrophia sp.]|uniref:hypothetical protein n=1 Tax=uncultured Abiotrophia sp. TaxID=316094 RepID=UPI0028D1479A|nr:hypothetical protein [uncultured Abiotrophia sp.]